MMCQSIPLSGQSDLAWVGYIYSWNATDDSKKVSWFQLHGHHHSMHGHGYTCINWLLVNQCVSYSILPIGNKTKIVWKSGFSYILSPSSVYGQEVIGICISIDCTSFWNPGAKTQWVTQALMSDCGPGPFCQHLLTLSPSLIFFFASSPYNIIKVLHQGIYHGILQRWGWKTKIQRNKAEKDSESGIYW